MKASVFVADLAGASQQLVVHVLMQSADARMFTETAYTTQVCPYS
jgi:hypothetical protein